MTQIDELSQTIGALQANAQARYAAKWALVKDLYRRGWDKQQVIDLFKVLD